MVGVDARTPVTLTPRSGAGLTRLPERACRRLLRLLRVEGLVHIAFRALRDEGWLRSYRARLPVTRAGAPLPWYTYPAIAFLDERLPRNARVFEYGAGNSTLWYAGRGHDVTTVENDESWYHQIACRLPGNAHCVLRPDRDSYIAEVGTHGGPFDVIVIDGQWRGACAQAAVDHLASSGIIIWDNSDMAEFEFDGAFEEVFRPAGFRELEWRGLGPVNAFVWSTSVLYRPGNLLAL